MLPMTRSTWDSTVWITSSFRAPPMCHLVHGHFKQQLYSEYKPAGALNKGVGEGVSALQEGWRWQDMKAALLQGLNSRSLADRVYNHIATCDHWSMPVSLVQQSHSMHSCLQMQS